MEKSWKFIIRFLWEPCFKDANWPHAEAGSLLAVTTRTNTMCMRPTAMMMYSASSSITPVVFVHKSRGDNVMCMWL